MRNWINLIEDTMVDRSNMSSEFDGIVYHCSDVRFDTFSINPTRGVYFSNEPDDAYGKFVYKCRVVLQHAAVDLSTDNIEIDRHILMDEGYDGRIVDYTNESDEEMYDVIAFRLDQITIMDVTQRP